jgi:murein DD-endopeptidase MepM/ murein hydrolase activator NlpD
VMKKALTAVLFLIVAVLVIRGNFGDIIKPAEDHSESRSKRNITAEISGTVKRGETLFDIFKKYKLDPNALFGLKEASANIYKLGDLYPGRPYKILIGDDHRIDSFAYWINDDSILKITRTDSGFSAEKVNVVYEKRILYLGGEIRDNLISSMGGERDDLLLALQLSDIFAWDIDFTTDIRNGDTFRIVVEGLYLDGRFRKYGNILSAEFVNNGERYTAYRFGDNGTADYYDAEGKSLRRAFLKAPLSFRRISSGFTQRRFHPILKIYRPHHGLDYAAPFGTPVSAIGDGTVIFTGYRGEYGNLVIIRHPNGYKTCYGHLSRIRKGVKRGKKIAQGDVLGYVGSTGLATGPHLHYEIRINNRPVNPLLVKLPRGKAVPETAMAQFTRLKTEMNAGLASIAPSLFACADRDGSSHKPSN